MSKNSKQREAPTTTSSKWPLGATGQRGAAACPSPPTASGAIAAPTAPSRCPLPLWAGALLYKSRELEVEALLTLTLSIFYSLSLSLLHHLQKYFPQALIRKKTL